MHNEGGKLVAVARISPTPYGNGPAVAAVGEAQAKHAAYLMRQCAVGITSKQLVTFVDDYVHRLHTDLLSRGHDIRYLLSLDDPKAWLIEGHAGPLMIHRGVTGKTYINAGALDAGTTKSRSQHTCWIDEAGQVRSIYASGKNLTSELAKRGVRFIDEGVKRRFVWVLAERGRLEYNAWHMRLPAWVKEPEWGQDGLGWLQPRLLYRRTLCLTG